MMFWKDGDRFFIVLSPALNSGKSEPREETSLMSCFLTDGDTLFFLLLFIASRYRGNWKGDLPQGKGEYQVLNLKLSQKNYFHWNLFNLEVFVPRSGQMETSSWASSKPVFPVERAFMRHNPETSLSEGWKGFKINFKF